MFLLSHLHVNINFLPKEASHLYLLFIVNHLTPWGLNKMADILQVTFSNAFSWMNMCEFRLKFHWSLFLRPELTILHHLFREWPGTDQATSHYLNQWWLVYWRIYASLGLNELTPWGLNKMADILPMTFSNAFLWMKSFAFWITFHKDKFISNWKNIQHLFRLWLGVVKLLSCLDP